MFRYALLSVAAVALLSASASAQTPAAQAAFDAGMAKKKAKDLKGAEADFVAATQADREFAQGWVELGNVRLKLGKAVPAIESFQMALAKDPELSVARYNLAFAYRQNKQHAAAADAYQAYLSKNPNDSDAYFGLAESLKAANKPLEAAQAFEDYARVEKRPAADKWRKQALAEAKKLRASAGPAAAPAPTPAAQPVAAAPTQPQQLSFSQNANKPAPTAAAAPVAASANATQAAPAGDRPAAFKTGMSSLKQGRFEEARARFETAYREAPTDFFVIAGLAGAYLGLGDGENAERYYRDALSRAPATARAALHMGVAEAARLRGDEAGARASCQLALGEKEVPPAVKRACAAQ